ncbi:MAG: hypothetical protein M1830_002000, partial [Pleopsidium flavum]
MSTSVLATTGAGAIFGAALTASGVYLPSVIVSQMQLSDFHMLKVFLGASASSALIMATFERLGIFTSCPRNPSSLNWFSNYDANILGGLMIGAGMTLTGACPGTVLVQLSTGIRSGFFVLIGGILGGILYTRFGRCLRNTSAPLTSETANTNVTVQSKLNLNPNRVLLAYETACLAIITLATYLAPHDVRAQLHPVMGGLLIGGAQATSILLTSKP